MAKKTKKRKYNRRQAVEVAAIIKPQAEKKQITIKGELNVTQHNVGDNLRIAVESLSNSLRVNAETIHRANDAALHNSEALLRLVTTLTQERKPVAVGIITDASERQDAQQDS